jgi:hypothetical protein
MCFVLDNSGSCQEVKLIKIKAAIEFVISTLSDKDRPSVVTLTNKCERINNK